MVRKSIKLNSELAFKFSLKLLKRSLSNLLLTSAIIFKLRKF